ncbi:cellobiose phosphotransferase system YdjC-like protein [Vibrio maritimus]|uniref:Cellobiose phosphotransferase system YdjC-like protein n=1 Tax=Vibrio maritimus TaxID=990268 RepID=A0A090T8D2_9VIBR|nr:cellobiose phosphotransferase system YdjC-like protein [Vibrio maritimus]
MKLILNADDFGLTESVNLAIVDCIKAGVVKSTTVMMNQPGTAHAATLNAQGLIPDVGLHFTLTSGKPIAEPSLIPS